MQPPMTVSELVKFSTVAFGPSWKRPLSQKCGISREQLWRYEKGITPLSDAAADKIKAALRKQLLELREQIISAIEALAWPLPQACNQSSSCPPGEPAMLNDISRWEEE